MPCASKKGVRVTRAHWRGQAGGTAWRRQAQISVSTGNLRFPRVTAVVSGYYECTGYVRLPRREVLIKVRHEIQVFDRDRNETGCRVGYIVSDERCCSFSPGGAFRNCMPCGFGTYTEKHGSPFCLWCPPGKSTYWQGSTSADDCEAATKEVHEKPASVPEEKQPLLAATTVASQQAVGIQTDEQCHVDTSHRAVQTETPEPKDTATSSAYPEKRVAAASKAKVVAPPKQETMFKELLAKTAKNAERLDRRKNTPQPKHYGSKTQDVMDANRRTFQKSPLAACTPAKQPPSLSPNPSAPRSPPKAGVLAPVTSPATKTPAHPRGRKRRRSEQPGSPNRRPEYYPSPEDRRRRALYSQQTRGDDVTRDVVRGSHEAAGTDASDGSYSSIPLHVRSGHVSPRRPAVWQPPPPRGHQAARRCIQAESSEGQFVNEEWHDKAISSPPGLRDDRHKHLGAYVSPAPPRGHQAARWCRYAAPSEGQFVNEVSHDKAIFIPPRGAISSPGIRKRPGDAHMIRRFGSSGEAWVTDEYSKHKQQGPAYYGSPKP
ncbi:hypothetical protein HPB52_020486 [Rhipicephalus sanguineus]|uniref:Tyrosine-protein kinase ephrin type A/B receptor-like domain-containing protein n=1 Tax=Rhipicephalus sanguineus TaxID=34632 RepID=A0A9D4PG48_RHISA|nr:hypothetical protein HPB52_020486 [Rhipicephalus sanguineus]